MKAPAPKKKGNVGLSIAELCRLKAEQRAAKAGKLESLINNRGGKGDLEASLELPPPRPRSSHPPPSHPPRTHTRTHTRMRRTHAERREECRPASAVCKRPAARPACWRLRELSANSRTVATLPLSTLVFPPQAKNIMRGDEHQTTSSRQTELQKKLQKRRISMGK